MPRTADPAPEVLTEPSGFAGGVNLRDTLTQLAPNQARLMENGILDEAGGFGKRLGCKDKGPFGVGADRVISMYTFYRADQTPQLLIQTSGGKLYYTTAPDADPITWTEITSGLSVNSPLSFETFNSKCYMSNGVDNYQFWTGTVLTAVPSAPKGKFLRLWKDTMWVSGVTGLPDRVFESDAGDAETFGVSSWIDLGKGDGDEVRALATDGAVLIVGKQKRAITIYDPVTLANKIVDFEKGFESHFAVVSFEGTLYFLSRRGICKWFGDSPSQVISLLIEPMFDPKILSLNNLSRAWAYVVDNRIGFAIPELGATLPTVQLEYYPRLGQLTAFGSRLTGPWTFQRMPAGTFSTYRSGANEVLYCGHNNDNAVMEAYAAIGTDNGLAFNAVMETGGYDFRVPGRTKYLRRIRALGRGKFIIQLKRDYANAIAKTFIVDFSQTTDLWDIADTWGEGDWGPDVVVKEKVLNPDAYGTVFQLRFTDTGTDVGKKLVEVGAVEYTLSAGGWAVYNLLLEGNVLGRRN